MQSCGGLEKEMFWLRGLVQRGVCSILGGLQDIVNVGMNDRLSRLTREVA